ncbi:ABC transporter permease [Streptococcus sanguinis]|nr:ABC transporter permease [Streptococcus sanguinis]MCY7040020.1 ABC transporter permease [Streptococcus sanguinis]
MKSFYKNIFRTIKQSLGRYLAILGITFLGSMMFSGLLSTSPSMTKTSDSYFSNANLFDIKIISNSMFSNKELVKISNQKNVKKILKTSLLDSQSEINSENYTLRLIALSSFDNLGMNKLTLIEGKMPKDDKEVVIVKPVEGFSDSKIKVGDKIKLFSSRLLKTDEVTIVGIVNSPEYFSNGSVSSSVGTGKIDFVIYGKTSLLLNEFYNQLYLTVSPTYIKGKGIANVDYSNKINQLKKSIREDISDSKNWLISDRDANVGYIALKNDINSISGVARIFPIIFIVVAAFVAMTTMTRLVEEERIIIGTLKSLGYSNQRVLLKYLIYSMTASILGSTIGAFVGFRSIPNSIWDTYSIKYSLPTLTQSVDWEVALISIIGLTIVTVISTLVSVRNNVSQTSSQLLVPQAPVAGKRVILERVTFIWKRISFLYKVTIRNVFLDKKRMWMTILGVMGCTMILVTAFGLRESLQNFTRDQYKEIFKYDATFGVKTVDNSVSKILESNDVKFLKFQNSSIEIEKENTNYNINLIVPELRNANIESFISLNDYKTNDHLSFDESSAIISHNIAQRLGVSEGDTITFNLYGDTEKKKVKISKITKNYQENYLYLSPKLYESLYKQKPIYNNYYIKFVKANNSEKNTLYKKLRGIEEVTYINKKQTIVNQIDEGLQGMNMIVIILIVAAGLLAFLVLYNINNINVSERTREISTLKVLGFKNGEVEAYVFREVIILTIFGCVLGLMIGYYSFLNVIKSIGTDFYVFNENISISTFVYSSIITLVFAMIINIFMIFKLRNINMLDSLKSVE